MWLTTPIGFYSIVEKVWDKDEGLLTVRARVREDLDVLRDRYLPSLGPTSEDPRSDYRFRGRGGGGRGADPRRGLRQLQGCRRHPAGGRPRQCVSPGLGGVSQAAAKSLAAAAHPSAVAGFG